MSVKKEYITIFDILKGLLFIVSLYIIYQLSPLIIQIWFIVFYWIADTSLFFIADEDRSNLLNIVFGLFIWFVFPKIIGFSRGACKANIVFNGYKPLSELINLFSKKNRVNKNFADHGVSYYISRTLLIIIFSLFLIGLFVKVKAFDFESIKDIVYNMRRYVELLFDSITTEG